jgi:hypothetical protein
VELDLLANSERKKKNSTGDLAREWQISGSRSSIKRTIYWGEVSKVQRLSMSYWPQPESSKLHKTIIFRADFTAQYLFS